MIDIITFRDYQIPLETRTSIPNPGPCCFLGEWNSDDPLHPIENLSEYLDQPGRDCFWQYKEGMTLEGGERRQKMETENRRQRINYRLMKFGLICSAVAAASGLVYVIDLIIAWLNH